MADRPGSGSLADMIGEGGGGEKRQSGGPGQFPPPSEEGTRKPRRRNGPNLTTGNNNSEDDNAWMQTYLDVITLMLTLFVMLLALAEFDPTGYQDFTEAMEGAVNRDAIPTPPPVGEFVGDKPGAIVGDYTPEAPDAPEAPVEEEDNTPSEDEIEQAREFLRDLREAGLLEQVDVSFTDGRITVELDDQLMFPSGGARLLEGGQELLEILTPILQATGRYISVEGHTDNVPIRSDRFLSNWDLSATRASEVVRYFESQGIDPVQMRAVGYGDTRPIASNDTSEGRARNRRVEVNLRTEQIRPPEQR
ncbi:MAG: OmpA/MotB family protein [Pseudomonadota bacterium]